MMILRNVLLLGAILCVPALVIAQDAVPQENESPAVTSLPAENLDSDTLAEFLPALAISNIVVEHNDGEYVIRWATNRPSAGALTYVAPFGDKNVQHRVTDGQFTREHRYVVSGLGQSTVQPILIEVVDQQMSYARKVVSLYVVGEPLSSPGAGMSSTMLYSTFFSLLAVALLSIEFWYFKQKLQDRVVKLEKKTAKSTRSTRAKKSPTTKKTNTQKRTPRSKSA